MAGNTRVSQGLLEHVESQTLEINIHDFHPLRTFWNFIQAHYPNKFIPQNPEALQQLLNGFRAFQEVGKLHISFYTSGGKLGVQAKYANYPHDFYLKFNHPEISRKQLEEIFKNVQNLKVEGDIFKAEDAVFAGTISARTRAIHDQLEREAELTPPVRTYAASNQWEWNEYEDY